MGLTGFLHLLWLVPLFVIGLYLFAFVMMIASVRRRNKNYLAGGIDLVDEMTQKQFGDYVASYLKHSGYSASLVRQDEETGTALLATKDRREIFVFVKRSRGGVSDEEVANALDLARAATAGEVQIITNSLLSRSKREQVKKQGVTVWDREKLIPYMGKAGARRFALQRLPRVETRGCQMPTVQGTEEGSATAAFNASALILRPLDAGFFGASGFSPWLIP